MDANTPGTNNGMTPQTPTSQPGAPQNTPMAASPSQSVPGEVSGENLRTRLNNLNSPNSVTSPRVTDARRVRRQVSMTPGSEPLMTPGPQVSEPLMTPEPQRSEPLMTPEPQVSASPFSPFSDSFYLGTPRASDGEDNENFEATPTSNAGSKEEVDLIELRF